MSSRVLFAAVALASGAFAQDPQGDGGRLLGSVSGLRPGAAELGLELEASTELELTVPSGRGASGRTVMSLDLSGDLEELIGLRGGSAFLGLRSFGGTPASDDLGDFQGISGLDAEDAEGQVSELWIAQELWRDRLELRAGLLDAGRFAALDKGGEFFTGSIGTSPTILGLPTWPDTALGGELFFEPSERLYLGIGFYDGMDPESPDPVTESPAPGPVDSGPFAIAEAGVVLPGGGNGRFAVGAWHNDAEFRRFDGGTQDGTGGFYALWEHHLWRENRYGGETEGLHGLALYGQGDDAVNEAAQHGALGLYYVGAIPRRDLDAIGLLASRVVLSSAGGAGSREETVYELFYKAAVTASTSLQVGGQYVDHVGGDPGQSAMVLGIRMSVAL